MKIENNLGLPTLSLLMEKIIIKEKLKALDDIVIKINEAADQKKRVCGGTFVPKGKDKEYEIVITCKSKGMLTKDFLNVFLDVFLHEVGHIWDAQQHGINHWRYDLPWKDRPQELIAENFMKRKLKTIYHVYPRLIKDIKQELTVKRKKLKKKDLV